MDGDISGLLNNEPIARRSLTLFYLIDTSGSMIGDKIGQVNTVMEEVIPEIRDIGGLDSDIRMAVMTFDDTVRWMYDEPKSIEEIAWTRLKAAGMTDLGEALIELNSKLSRNGFMKSASMSFAPVIFLLSDGVPNFDYRKGMDAIKQNKWFKSALKIAVAIGKDADKSILAEFTGNPETVVEVNNGPALSRMIRSITITSSQIGSKSSSLESEGLITPEEADAAKEQEMIQAIKGAVRPEDIDFDDGW